MVQRLVKPPTLSTAVANSIRDSIFHGDLHPGEPLREVELSESMDVSRGTIREALRKLQDENLVEVIPHRGAFVTRLTPRTAEELYTLRAVIEPHAVQLAMTGNRYSDDDLKQLGRLARRLDALEEGGGDIYETVKTDVEFHYLICSRSGHGLLLETFKTLQSLMWLFVLNVQLCKSDAYSDEPAHVEIYEAIKSGDPQRASESLRTHILSAGKALLFCMEERGKDRG